MRVKLVKSGKTPEEPVETPEIKVDPTGDVPDGLQCTGVLDDTVVRATMGT